MLNALVMLGARSYSSIHVDEFSALATYAYYNGINRVGQSIIIEHLDTYFIIIPA